MIRQAIERHRPDPEDPVDVLCKVGGCDIAGPGRAVPGRRIVPACPCLLDGIDLRRGGAVRRCGCVRPASDAMVASHASAEPAGAMLLQALGLKPLIYGGHAPGRGHRRRGRHAPAGYGL